MPRKTIKAPTKRTKKAPPSPTKRRKKAPAAVNREATLAMAIAPPPDLNSLEYLRFAAGNFYTTHVNGVSVPQMMRIHPFDKVAPTTLEGWARIDKWGPRRRKFAEMVQVRLADKLADKIVAERLDALEVLQKEFTSMQGKIGFAEPKSYEGMISSFVKLGQFIDTLRQEVLDPINARASQGGRMVETGDVPIKPQLTVTEARAAAEAVMRARQAEVRQRIAAGKNSVETVD